MRFVPVIKSRLNVKSDGEISSTCGRDKVSACKWTGPGGISSCFPNQSFHCSASQLGK